MRIRRDIFNIFMTKSELVEIKACMTMKTITLICNMTKLTTMSAEGYSFVTW